MTSDRSVIDRWSSNGSVRLLCGRRIFTIDLPALGPERSEPLLIVHGYPTSSYDYASVLAALRVGRRVLTLDLLGYGLSEKPDEPYTLSMQAGIVEAFVASAGITRLAMLTHDMGDTLGGELLARQLEGSWRVQITKRVLTNGSIYIEMAQLTAGQQMLLGLPDLALPDELAPDEHALAVSLQATLSPTSTVTADGLLPHASMICHFGGNRLLARTIRYIEERRLRQDRYTGAIEKHPSPLAIVWGAHDPIALPSMAERLAAATSDSTLTMLEGVGHYPSIEAPERFVDAVLRGLNGSSEADFITKTKT